VADIRWLPASLTHWADYHGRVRNIPAFAVLALPFMLICPSPRARRTAIFGLAAFAATLELLQYFIPTRYCEWQDIACSWIGLALTWVSFEFASWAAWRIYRSFPRR
jgi:VanZ family protein